LKVDPEAVLRAANAKFRRRFAVMERKAGGFEELGKLGANELEALWSKAKADGEIRS
jgi:nucleoside triphosphate diphosphatase